MANENVDDVIHNHLDAVETPKPFGLTVFEKFKDELKDETTAGAMAPKSAVTISPGPTHTHRFGGDSDAGGDIDI